MAEDSLCKKKLNNKQKIGDRPYQKKQYDISGKSDKIQKIWKTKKNQNKDDTKIAAGLVKTLNLAEGARVVLRRNLNQAIGLVNGATGYLCDFEEEKALVDIQSIVEYNRLKNIIGLPAIAIPAQKQNDKSSKKKAISELIKIEKTKKTEEKLKQKQQKEEQKMQKKLEKEEKIKKKAVEKLRSKQLQEVNKIMKKIHKEIQTHYWKDVNELLKQEKKYANEYEKHIKKQYKHEKSKAKTLNTKQPSHILKEMNIELKKSKRKNLELDGYDKWKEDVELFLNIKKPKLIDDISNIQSNTCLTNNITLIKNVTSTDCFIICAVHCLESIDVLRNFIMNNKLNKPILNEIKNLIEKKNQDVEVLRRQLPDKYKYSPNAVNISVNLGDSTTLLTEDLLMLFEKTEIESKLWVRGQKRTIGCLCTTTNIKEICQPCIEINLVNNVTSLQEQKLEDILNDYSTKSIFCTKCKYTTTITTNFDSLENEILFINITQSKKPIKIKYNANKEISFCYGRWEIIGLIEYKNFGIGHYVFWKKLSNAGHHQWIVIDDDHVYYKEELNPYMVGYKTIILKSLI